MKSFTYQVSRNGTPVAEWASIVTSHPSFSKEVDSTLSPMTISLQLPFGYNGTDLAVGNTVEMFCHDGVTRLIHAGLIEKIQRGVTASGESVEVTVIPWGAQLSRDYFVDSASGDISLLFDDEDVTTVLKYLLDCQTAAGGNFNRVHYTTDSMIDTEHEVTIEIGSERYLDAVQRVKALGPGNWYWYVDAIGTFIYRNYDSGRKHVFTLGRDVSEIRYSESIESLRNTVYFWNGSDADGSIVAVERPGSSTPSQETYGRRVELLRDDRIEDQATAEGIADRYITENESPVVTLDIVVMDDASAGGYDIESIEPGDTCEIRNALSISGTVYSVTRVAYAPDAVRLTLMTGVARRTSTFGKSMEDIAQYITRVSDGSIPNALT